MKKAALLARVSTGNQKKGSSPEDQLDRTKAFAEKNGYEIVDEGLDVISGSFILARTTFNRYLEMMSESKLDVIIVDIPDRLGRGDAIAKCELLAELNGGKIVYAQPGRDDSTIEGMALKLTDSLVSGIERINIRRRTMNGKKKWASSGRIIASPFRPYGYEFVKEYDSKTGHKVDCNLVPVEDEEEIVIMMFEWCAIEGLTTYRIAKRLTEMGIPTLADTDKIKKKKLKGFGIWHKDTVHGILTNPTYKGEWHFRKNRVKRIDTVDGVKSEVTKRDEEELIPISVPVIISPELWDLAQERLKENAKRNYKPTRHHYLLRGRLTCAKCEGAMVGWTREYKGKTKTTKNSWYRCAKKYQFGINSPNSCHVDNLRCAAVDSLVWDELVALVLDEDKLFGKIKVQEEKNRQSKKSLEHSIVILEMKNKADKESLEKMLDLYLGGHESKEKYLAKKKKIDRLIIARQEEIAKLRMQLDESNPLSPDREAALRLMRRELAGRLDGASFAQKLRTFDMLHVKCKYHDDTKEIVVIGIFGALNLSLTLEDDEEGGTDVNELPKKGGKAKNGSTSSVTSACYP